MRITLSRTTFWREKVSSPDNVALILKGASTGQSVCVSCVAYGGLQMGVLGQAKVYNGLRLGALPDLGIESLEFSGLPALVFVRSTLS